MSKQTKACNPFAVVCLNAKSYLDNTPSGLTEGKHYIVATTSIDEKSWGILNDFDVYCLYEKDRFERLP